MRYLLPALLTSLLLFTSFVHAGEISGIILDPDQKPVSGATVVLCDHDTGIPVSKQTYKPCTEPRMYMAPNSLVTVVTDTVGQFIFKDIPKGKYRLITQSWEAKPSVQNIFDRNSKEIILHGVAGEISVPSKEATNIKIVPQGTGVATLDEEFPNDDSLLLVSTKPLSADPILGFVSWRGPFLQNLIGANRMLSGFTKIRGLPNGTIHLSVFANDNNGGIGAGSVEAKSNESVKADYIPIVCSWSNGRHTPPKELEKIFEEVEKIYLQEKKYLVPFFSRLLAKKGITVKMPPEGTRNILSVYYPHLQEVVTLPSGCQVPFADVLASAQYIGLQSRIEKRKKTSNKPDAGDGK